MNRGAMFAPRRVLQFLHGRSFIMKTINNYTVQRHCHCDEDQINRAAC